MPARDDLVRNRGHVIAFTRAAAAVAASAVAAVLVLGVVTIVQVRQAQQQNSPLVEQVAQGNERIKDCTTPAGECYQRGQEATADAIKILLQGTKAQTRAAALASATAAAICIKADPASTVPEIAACVKEHLQLVGN